MLLPRKNMQVAFEQTGMSASEWQIFKQKHKLKGAVLIPLLNYENKASILFTQRTNKVLTHANEIVYIGGDTDHKDQSLLHSALRGFHEDLGVHFLFKFANEMIAEQFHTSMDASAVSEKGQMIHSQPYFSSSTEPGVNPLEIHVLGSLFDSVPSHYGTSVQPIVAFIKLSKLHEIKKSNLIHDCLNIDTNTIRNVFCVPVDELTNPKYQMKEHLNERGASMRYKVPSSTCGDICGLSGYLTLHLINHILLPSLRNQLR